VIKKMQGHKHRAPFSPPFILCPASQKSVQGEKIILNIQSGGTVKNDNWPFNDRKPYSIWFKNRYRAFACGDGIFIRDFH
jgi:hypothetical protein